MSAVANCDCPCPTVTVTEIPGSPGLDGSEGTPGSDGISSFSFLSAAFDVPAVGNTETIFLLTTAWMGVGQNIFIPGAGYFQTVSFPGATSAVVTYLAYPENTHTGETIASGTLVTPAGVMPVVTGITALTDSTGGTPSDTLAAGVGITTLSFPIQLAAMTTAAADLVTNYVPGYAFKILAISYTTTTIGAGASASQVLNMEIGTTNLTGGVLTLLLADTDTLGELKAATTITAANVGTATDSISVEVAAGGTVFTAGAGIILIKIQNLDDANAIASLSDHFNDLLAQLD